MPASKGDHYASLVDELRRRSGSKALDGCHPNPKDYSSIHGSGPIYDVLRMNLLEQGCPTAAKYFEKLVAKENEVFLADVKMKTRVRDAHCLLLAVFENLKSAEFGYRKTGDKALTLRLLTQTVHMIQVQDDAFHWLVEESYRIILKISEGWQEECAELLSRTYFEYGIILTEKGVEHLQEAIFQMNKSLKICKGTMWYTNDRDRNILHEDVCVKLCEALLHQAEKDSQTDPKKAAEWAYQAVITLEEVGICINVNLYCVATLRQSEYLIADRDYDGALEVLNNLQVHIMGNDSPRNKCEFYLRLGICHFNLSPLRYALRKLKLSVGISEKYTYDDLKASALLFMGRIHAKTKNAVAQAQARQHFIEAKDLFHRLRDYENEKLARFLIAKLRAYQIFPSYIELIRRASWNSFCNLFHLIQWKQRMLPFWNENIKLNTQIDECQCILDEKVGKELSIMKD